MAIADRKPVSFNKLLRRYREAVEDRTKAHANLIERRNRHYFALTNDKNKMAHMPALMKAKELVAADQAWVDEADAEVRIAVWKIDERLASMGRRQVGSENGHDQEE